MTGDKAKEFWLGFDLGGTKMLAQVYDSDWKMVGRERKKTRPGSSASGGLERIGDTIRDALKDAKITEDQLHGIGIGCPGPVDMAEGRLLQPPNLAWGDVHVREFLQTEFRCPVAVVNDVDAGVYAEYRFGAAEKSRCVLGVFAGTGIGGGCVYNGEIIRGHRSSSSRSVMCR